VNNLRTMALPSWQVKAAETAQDAPATVQVPFHDAKKFFAVDASGSTRGEIMKAQKRTVMALHGNPDDHVALWDTQCGKPSFVDAVGAQFFDGYGGTSPVAILNQPLVVDQIKGSDLWILLTDGEIFARDVTELTQTADALDVIQIPVVLIVVGARYKAPDQANLSVCISFFANAREALILYKDYATGQLFVIDAKGAFEPLKVTHSDDLSDWNSLPTYTNEAALDKHCGELGIGFAPNEGRSVVRAVCLGPEWDTATGNVLVDVPALLEQRHLRYEDLRKVLQEEAVTQLALLCKTRGQLGRLRDLFLRHKQEDIVVRLEDRHGAGKIMEKLQDTKPEEMKELMELLRRAHTANRETYLTMQDSPSEEVLLSKVTNKLINQGLAIIADFEKASYTAEILNRKSNRAMRSQTVSAADAEIHISALDLSDGIDAFRGTCPICCGEEQIMSVVLKSLDTVEENTTDFALNFPLAAAQAQQNADMVSSQCICFQCALLLPRSIFQEEIAATIPSIDYEGINQKYIDHQLTMAITAGLATGASGIVQLFMTILDRTLETKDWCSIDNAEDVEVRDRRQVLDWTLQNLLRNCRCRENFNETGEWVGYPQALRSAVKEYETAGLDSWIIQYPLAGFSQLLRWYELLGVVAKDKIQAVQNAKLIHQVVTAMMNGLLRQKDGDKSWTYPFLGLVYQEFNAPGVPRDLGPASLVSAGNFWPRLKHALGEGQHDRRFLSWFEGSNHDSVCRNMASRIQLLTFWALYMQNGHTMPKTFFANTKSREPLAPAILDPTGTVPQKAIVEVLMSIFCPVKASQNAHLSNVMPPFASPFGASVLRCGIPGCSFEFLSKEENKHGAKIARQTIRARRAEHLSKFYGSGPSYTSQTGLPDPTSAPKAPASYHNTLHISTARVWSRLVYSQKQAVSECNSAHNDSAVANFAQDVRLEICAKSHRGNIYSATIDDEVRTVLPSFLVALRTASRHAGLEDKTGLSYLHDWTKNTIVSKMEYELK